MGLDLTLFPIKNMFSGREDVLAFDRLRLDRDYKIFKQITKIDDDEPTIKTIAIPPQISVEVYEDEGIISMREDAYGTELTYASAKELKKLKVFKNSSDFNKAIKAFINALSDEHFIILYWC